MNKIINNKRYNTETAKLLATWHNGELDINFCEESLYLKMSGGYFIHGQGGANSKYRKYNGNNNWGWGEEIIPLTYAEAKEWAEKMLSGDEYEKIFGEVDENAEPVQLLLKPDAATAAAFREAAQKRGISLVAMFTEMVQAIPEME